MPTQYFLGADSAPPTPPPAALASRVGQAMTWTGWDGSVWPLTEYGGDAGVLVTNGGMRGWGMPEVEVFSSRSVGVHGQQGRGGYYTSPRSVFWPLWMWHDGSTGDWLDLDRRFWATMMPGRYGTWTTESSDGTVRTLVCRWDSTDDTFEVDPALDGWTLYGVKLIADDPFWRGPAVEHTYMAPSGDNFYGGGPGNQHGYAYPFVLAPSNTVDRAVIENPGDLEAWPVWTVTGPTVSVTLGIAGRTVSVPFALAAGQQLVIDTSPMVQSAMIGATSRTRDLGSANFAPIPPGSSVPLSIVMDGSGSVACRIVPRYLRAW